MEQKSFTLGPWGGSGGDEWNDGYFRGVREIYVEHGEYILSITAVYDKEGRPFKGKKHGGVNPSTKGKTSKVSLIIYSSSSLPPFSFSVSIF